MMQQQQQQQQQAHPPPGMMLVQQPNGQQVWVHAQQMGSHPQQMGWAARDGAYQGEYQSGGADGLGGAGGLMEAQNGAGGGGAGGMPAGDLSGFGGGVPGANGGGSLGSSSGVHPPRGMRWGDEMEGIIKGSDADPRSAPLGLGLHLRRSNSLANMVESSGLLDGDARGGGGLQGGGGGGVQGGGEHQMAHHLGGGIQGNLGGVFPEGEMIEEDALDAILNHARDGNLLSFDGMDEAMLEAAAGPSGMVGDVRMA